VVAGCGIHLRVLHDPPSRQKLIGARTDRLLNKSDWGRPTKPAPTLFRVPSWPAPTYKWSSRCRLDLGGGLRHGFGHAPKGCDDGCARMVGSRYKKTRGRISK